MLPGSCHRYCHCDLLDWERERLTPPGCSEWQIAMAPCRGSMSPLIAVLQICLRKCKTNTVNTSLSVPVHQSRNCNSCPSCPCYDVWLLTKQCVAKSHQLLFLPGLKRVFLPVSERRMGDQQPACCLESLIFLIRGPQLVPRSRMQTARSPKWEQTAAYYHHKQPASSLQTRQLFSRPERLCSRPQALSHPSPRLCRPQPPRR